MARRDPKPPAASATLAAAAEGRSDADVAKAVVIAMTDMTADRPGSGEAARVAITLALFRSLGTYARKDFLDAVLEGANAPVDPAVERAVLHAQRLATAEVANLERTRRYATEVSAAGRMAKRNRPPDDATVRLVAFIRPLRDAGLSWPAVADRVAAEPGLKFGGAAGRLSPEQRRDLAERCRITVHRHLKRPRTHASR